MAAALLNGDIKGHASAVMVVLDIYPQIMREMIPNIFPPKGIFMQIQNEPNQTFLNQLKITEKKMISKLDSTGYNELDTSCLYKVIRYFNLLPPPKAGWGQKPRHEDIGQGDDVERMKKDRNDILHRPRGFLSESEKHIFFQQSIEIAKRIDIRRKSLQSSFESKIKNIQLSVCSMEKHIEVLEKCAEYRALLQEKSAAPCFNLYYGQDIQIKLDAKDENGTNGSSSCIIYLKDPHFDGTSVIEKLDEIKEKILTKDITLKYAEIGSLNIHVSVLDQCFLTKEILHKSIQYFLYEFFRAASIQYIKGHIYTVVLADSCDLGIDNCLTERVDLVYLKEKPSPVLKFHVEVKDSAFQNEFELYKEVNRFISGMYLSVDRQNVPVNGSAREVLMLTNERVENSTSRHEAIEDHQLRMAQEPVVSKEDSNYFKIATLLLRIAPRAVRIKFDDVFPAMTLKETLNLHKSKIDDLKTARCINQVHWKTLFPRKGDPISQSFDTTLMICLLQNLKGIHITNQIPYHTDYSVGADLSRINIYRKDIANSNKGTFKNQLFTTYWKDIEAAVLRLSGGILKGECSNLKTKSYVVADRKNALNNIQAGKRLVQIEVEDRLGKFENKQGSFMAKKEEEWEEESSWFVQTKAFTYIVNNLDERHLTVVGNPGMGKSMLLHQTAIYLRNVKGYSIYSCRGPSDLVSQFRTDTKQVFILDDALGQYRLVQSNVDQWKQYEVRIARLLQSKSVVVLSSCRSDVFIEKQCQSLLIFSGCRCDLNDGDNAIDRQEKLTIAKRYLSQQTISEVISDVDRFDTFPLLCRLYTERVTLSSIKFFHEPFNFYKEELDGFYKEDGGIKCCSLFLCVIHNGYLNQTILMDESTSPFWQEFKAVFEEFRLDPIMFQESVLYYLDTLVNLYLIKKDDDFHVLHDRLFDFLCFYFGQRHQQLMINFADSRIIRDRTLLDTSQTSSEEFTIVIDTQNENDYIQRLVKDMLSGNIEDVLYNHQMRYMDFRCKLLAHLQKLDDDDFTVTNVLSEFLVNENVKPCILIPINFACKYGYKELFHFFLTKTKDINAYEGNNIPLITACRKGDTYMTGLLLDRGADVNQTDVLGCSPLLWSCVYGNLSIIKMLLNQTADIENIEVYNKSSPLIWACVGEFLLFCKSLHIIKEFPSSSIVDEVISIQVENANEQYFTQEQIIDVFLTVLKNGYSRGCFEAEEKYVKGTPSGFLSDVRNILRMISRDDKEVDHDVSIQSHEIDQTSPFIEIMNLFFDRGVDIDKSSIGGITALSFACMVDMHKSQSVSYLLSKGAFVNKCDIKETYPLEIAMKRGKENLVKLLVDNGAIVNCSADGISPIDWAISKQNILIVDSLINAGANIDKSYENGTTLIHCAIKSCNEEIIKLLIKGGISVNCVNSAGETPLMVALNLGLSKSAAFFIKKGANVDTYDSKGQSSLMIASSKGHVDMVEMMLREKRKFTKRQTVDCLFSACRNNHMQVVSFLLKKGCDINIAEPKYGNTCLIEAVRDGYACMVALLLDKGANTNASNSAGETPLTMASKNGHTEIARLLVSKEATMYESNNNIECSLILACINNHLDIVKLLIDNGCNIDCIEKTNKQTCLSLASYYGYDKIAAYLIEHGANVNSQNYKGNTPLRLATLRCHFNIVKMLVENLADIDIRNKEGSTAVSAASYHRNYKILAYLIENGADVNTLNNKGNTPLMLGASNGHLKIVQMLIENKADINIQNEEGFTCIAVACYHGNDEIVAYLNEHGASVNTQNSKGNTPLMLASSKGHLNVAKILIVYKAEINIRNDIGNTALILAVSKGHLNIAEMLVKHGADVDIRNEEGSTCLSVASGKGLDSIVRYLLGEIASINTANNNGDSPLMLASKNGHASTFNILLDYGAKVNNKNKQGLSSLDFARQNGHSDIADVIYEISQREFKDKVKNLILLILFILTFWLYIVLHEDMYDADEE